jgi:hypothetical protein
MPTLGKKVMLDIAPGVNPITDNTELNTIYYTNCDKIRFEEGRARKIGGWVRQAFTNFQQLAGCIRSVYSYISANGSFITMISTSNRLYIYQNGSLFNITPLNLTTIPLPNSLQTVFLSPAPSNCISTTIGSNIVTFNINNYLNPGDSIQISGVSSNVGGIPTGQLNGTFIVIRSGAFYFQVVVQDIATSTASGGGNSIVFSTQQIYITYVNHGLQKGDRIKISGVTSDPFGGIPAIDINGEFVITNYISPNQFVIDTNTFATSYANGGGSGITIQTQIAAGYCDATQPGGYGAGLYGEFSKILGAI